MIRVICRIRLFSGFTSLCNVYIVNTTRLMRQPTATRTNGGQFNSIAKRLEINSNLSNNFSTVTSNWCCEKCGKSNMRYILMCAKCHHIINPTQIKSFTHFEILDQERKFDINITELARHFRRLQSHLHPDKFANKDQIEQEHSLDVSARVNRAYQTLLKATTRAAYLLELNGKPFEEKSVQMDQEFLADIMEVNEQVSNCANMEEAQMLKETNDRKLKVYYKEISECFDRDDLDGALFCLAKLNYFENINEKMKDIIMKYS